MSMIIIIIMCVELLTNPGADTEIWKGEGRGGGGGGGVCVCADYVFQWHEKLCIKVNGEIWDLPPPQM